MSVIRIGASVAISFLAVTCVRAATPKEIETAIQNGNAFLKKSGGDNAREARDPDRVGATALMGLALLESGSPADDPAVKKITERLREASYTQTQTYQISLCILYFDRLGDPGDRPLIQMLAVRLLAGQTYGGGWTYGCISAVPPATERFLRSKLSDATLTAGKEKPAPKPGTALAANTASGKPAVVGKLHADVAKYSRSLTTVRKGREFDDNSNTQFGILGVWVARKHGVPVDHALGLVEKRFLATQGNSGGWPYHGPMSGPDGSPSMTCAGLIGLATAVARREERTLKAEVAKQPKKAAEPTKTAPHPGTDPNDPFFNPPKPIPADPADKADPPAAKPKKKPADTRDAAVKRAMDNLANALAGQVKGRRNNIYDLYFLWSLERVGVIYGVVKIGEIDWYDYASDLLVRAQNADGSWGGAGLGGYGPDVDTSFALLVLSRSNLVRDLSAKVQKDLNNTELRAGARGPTALAPRQDPKPEPKPMATIEPAVKPLPAVKPAPAKPLGTTPADIAAELFRASGANWTMLLQKVRDAKGAENTSALLAVIPLLDGDRKKTARDALADRLCRMNATTLRGMLKASDAELRRAAALACAMKDDKTHIADLIAVLDDKDANVARAARAGLKSLTGKNFTTAAEWRDWFASQNK
jgi:hypothetical protein